MKKSQLIMGIKMKLDQDEVEVICKNCNSYLWSVSKAEMVDAHHLLTDEARNTYVLIACPCKRDPLGHCTGIYKTR